MSSVPQSPQFEHNPNVSFHPRFLDSKACSGLISLNFSKGQVVFSQGEPADSVFQIHKGKLKLTVVSNQGKEAVIGLLTPGDFFGEGCLAGQTSRKYSATTMSDCVAVRVDKPNMIRVLHTNPELSEFFLQFVLSRNMRIQDDLVDQLFNSSEKRLARVLLLLASVGEDGQSEAVTAKFSQEMLAEIVGTTRARVNFFMNKFRRMGFIDYDGSGLRIYKSLVDVVKHG